MPPSDRSAFLRSLDFCCIDLPVPVSRALVTVCIGIFSTENERDGMKNRHGGDRENHNHKNDDAVRHSNAPVDQAVM
jgi:hypothetical protein